MFGTVVGDMKGIKTREQLGLVVGHEKVVSRVENLVVSKVICKNIVDVVQELPTITVVRGDP